MNTSPPTDALTCRAPLNKNKATALISVVIPLFNESEQLPDLISALEDIDKNSFPLFEFIFVDDGSSDDTRSKVQEHAAKLRSWKLVILSHNFGMQAACRAGINHANGDAIALLDADLQDPPELLLEMVTKWIAGASLVVGVRRSRPERGLRGLLLSLFHWTFKLLTDGVMPQDSGNFALMDASVAARMKQLGESNYFLPALRAWSADSIATVEYDRHARLGSPRQTLGKLMSYAWDAITSFSDKPLRFISALGFFIAIPSFLYGVVLVMQRILQFFGLFKDLEVLGFTTVAVAVFFMGGVQLICLGVIGEYVARTYREAKHRPPYFIREVLSGKRENK